MTRRIRLTRYAADTVKFNNYGAYRLRIEVTAVEGEDLDEYIFIYRRNEPSPYSKLNCDVFEAVAGPPQLAGYPILEPSPDAGWPYYRMNYVELDVASTAQAESIWQEIQRETCALVSAMNRLEKLKVVEDVWCPGPPDDASQSSASV